MAQSVKRPALDFGSGHDLKVHEIETQVSSVLSAQDSLSLSLSAPSPIRARCRIINKINLKTKIGAYTISRHVLEGNSNH